jgi:hypothetical protein
LDDRRRVAAKHARAGHLHQFDLGRLGDLEPFAIIIDRLHDDIEWLALNWIWQA